MASVSEFVIRTLLAVGVHGQQDIVVQGTVLGEVFKNAFDGQLQAIHIGIRNLFTDAFLHAAHLLRKAPAHHHATPLAQHLHRITGKDRPVEDLEEAGIGTDEGGLQFISVLIQVRITVENESGTRTGLNTGDFFHEAHRYSTAYLAIIVFIPLVGVPGIDGIHPVDVLVEAVVTQLKEHLGNEHDAHRQPDTQGKDLD